MLRRNDEDHFSPSSVAFVPHAQSPIFVYIMGVAIPSRVCAIDGDFIAARARCEEVLCAFLLIITHIVLRCAQMLFVLLLLLSFDAPVWHNGGDVLQHIGDSNGCTFFSFFYE